MSTDKPKTSELDVFVPNTLTGDWEPKPLSISGSIQLTRMVGNLLATTARHMQAVDLANLNATHVMILFSAIDEDVLRELFAIVLRKSPQWVEEHWNFDQAIQCFLVFWQRENMANIFLTASRLANQAFGQTGSAPASTN